MRPELPGEGGRPVDPFLGGAGARPPAPPLGTGGAGWIPPTLPPHQGTTPPHQTQPSRSTASPFPPPYPNANPYVTPPSAVPTSEYGQVRDIYDPNFAAAFYGGALDEQAAREIAPSRLTGLEPRTFRRRRAVLSAIATTLAVVLVVGLIAFALWQTQQGDDGREVGGLGPGTPPPTEAAGAAEPTAAGEAGADDGALPAAPDAGTEGDEAPTEESAADTETADEAAGADAEAAGDAAGDERGGADESDGTEPEPTPNPGGRSLANLVPAEDEVPEGLVLTDEGRLDEEAVAATFIDPEAAATQLAAWGWRGNLYRQFEPSPETPAGSEDINFLVVSVHRFDSDEAADEALTYFSDAVIQAQGLEVVEIEPLGDEAIALVGNPEEANLVVVYVRTGPYMIRIGGSSPEGDPLAAIVELAQVILVNEPDEAARAA